jgi:hypothetical protein
MQPRETAVAVARAAGGKVRVEEVVEVIEDTDLIEVFFGEAS